MIDYLPHDCSVDVRCLVDLLLLSGFIIEHILAKTQLTCYFKQYILEFNYMQHLYRDNAKKVNKYKTFKHFNKLSIYKCYIYISSDQSSI